MCSWQNVAVIATDTWSVERFLSEYRGSSRSKRTTTIALTGMEYQEDKYVAAIPNDTNAGGPIEGDKMRSRALRVLLKLDPSVVTESLLHYVKID